MEFHLSTIEMEQVPVDFSLSQCEESETKTLRQLIIPAASLAIHSLTCSPVSGWYGPQ